MRFLKMVTNEKIKETRDVLLSEVEAAKMLGLKRRTLQMWRFTGSKLPFCRFSGRCIKYRLQDINEFIEKSITNSTSTQNELEREGNGGKNVKSRN